MWRVVGAGVRGRGYCFEQLYHRSQECVLKEFGNSQEVCSLQPCHPQEDVEAFDQYEDGSSWRNGRRYEPRNYLTQARVCQYVNCQVRHYQCNYYREAQCRYCRCSHVRRHFHDSGNVYACPRCLPADATPFKEDPRESLSGRRKFLFLKCSFGKARERRGQFNQAKGCELRGYSYYCQFQCTNLYASFRIALPITTKGRRGKLEPAIRQV